MSRTIRIRNLEQITPRHGDKTYGYYGQDSGRYIQTGNGHGGHLVTRAPTYQEYRKDFWRNHSESKSSFARGPNCFYTNPVNRQLRVTGKEWIRKWSLNPEEVEIIHFFKRDQRRVWWLW